MDRSSQASSSSLQQDNVRIAPNSQLTSSNGSQGDAGAVFNSQPASPAQLPTGAGEGSVDADGRESNAGVASQSTRSGSGVPNAIAGSSSPSSSENPNSTQGPQLQNGGRESSSLNSAVSEESVSNGEGASPGQNSPLPSSGSSSDSVAGGESTSPSQENSPPGSSPADNEGASSPEQGSQSLGSSSLNGENVTPNEASSFAGSSPGTSGSNASPGENPSANPSSITVSPKSGNNTDDPLCDSELVAPLSQINAIQDFVNNNISGQANLTAFEDQLEARLSAYLEDYIIAQKISLPNDVLTTRNGTTELQNIENQSQDNLTRLYERFATDIYLFEVILNTTYQHFNRVRTVIGDECR